MVGAQMGVSHLPRAIPFPAPPVLGLGMFSTFKGREKPRYSTIAEELVNGGNYKIFISCWTPSVDGPDIVRNIARRMNYFSLRKSWRGSLPIKLYRRGQSSGMSINSDQHKCAPTGWCARRLSRFHYRFFVAQLTIGSESSLRLYYNQSAL